MKILRMFTMILAAIVLLCGSFPLGLFAVAAFDFSFAQNYHELAVGDSVQLYPTSTEQSIIYTYDSIDPTLATVNATGRVTARKAGVAQIRVTGTNTQNNELVTKTLNITILGKLRISSSTPLDKRLGDQPFIFNVSFNVKKSDVTYSFSIYDEDVATIDENTGRVKIMSVGETFILVEAFADGYQDESKEFELIVEERATASNSNDTGEIVLNGGTDTSAGTAGAAITAAANNLYKDLKFTGRLTVNGTEFLTTNNFSVGTKFAIKTKDNDGDWWRSPEAFTGSRGIYTAKSEGVSELVYADTAGKTYNFKVNTYKLVKYSNFMIPERIPVGAAFSILAPTDKPGIWGKNSSMLSGSRGTYIPLKAGKTTISYTTKDLKYSVTITIVDDTPPAAPLDASAATGATGAGDPSSETPVPPSVIILN